MVRGIPSLNRRIAVLSTLLLLAFLGLSTFLIDYYSQQFREDISRRNLTLARAFADNVQVFLDHHIQELIESRDEITGPAVDGEKISEELDTLRAYYPLFEVVQILDRLGVVRNIVPYETDQIGIDLSSMPFYREFISHPERRILWSDSFVSPLTNDPAITVILPLGDGALVAQVNLSRLSRFVQESRPFAAGFVAIVDRRGVAIAHTDQSMVAQAYNLRSLTSVREGLAGRMGSYNDTYQGARGLASVSGIEPSGWLVVVFQPDSESLGIVDRIQGYLRIVLFSALLLFFVTIYWVQRRGLDTLKRVEQETRRISKGHYDEEVVPKYREFEQLSESFNQMSRAVASREEALRVSEEQYRSLFQDNPLPMMIIERETLRILEVNRMAVEHYGYSREEFAERTALQIRPPEDRGRALQAITTAEGGRRNLGVWRHLKKDGSVILVDITSYDLFFEGKKAILAICNDVTEKHRFQEILEESERNYRELVEGANSIVLRWGPDGEIKFINRYGEEFFGFAQEELLGRSVTETIVPPTESTGRDLAHMIDSIIANPEAYFTNENENIRKSGERAWVSWTNRPIFDRNGQLREILSIGMDVSDRKRAEGELENYRQNLEKLVAERTSELEEAQADLLIAERLATLGQLTATVSHEIRNPLGTVKNSIFSIGDALEKNDMDRLAKALLLAERNIRRVDTIIGELLDYTRQRELVPVTTRMDPWLEETLRDLEVIPQWAGCRQKLSSGVTLRIDRDYLRQAVINIVTNAVQAMEEKGREMGCVDVETAVSGNRFEIRITDEGPGIPEKNLMKIFEPLFSTKSFGVGLGLPIVMKIMEQHRGGLEILSREGDGTTAILWLPMADPA